MKRSSLLNTGGKKTRSISLLVLSSPSNLSLFTCWVGLGLYSCRALCWASWLVWSKCSRVWFLEYCAGLGTKSALIPRCFSGYISSWIASMNLMLEELGYSLKIGARFDVNKRSCPTLRPTMHQFSKSCADQVLYLHTGHGHQGDGLLRVPCSSVIGSCSKPFIPSRGSGCRDKLKWWYKPVTCTSISPIMKVTVKHWHAVAQWRWDTGNTGSDDADGEGDVCGICRVPFEGCCPSCKMPGDDCPLSNSFVVSGIGMLIQSSLVWGECTHVFHLHCLLKWLGTAASKQQCPMDRRTWGRLPKSCWYHSFDQKAYPVTAERKVGEGHAAPVPTSWNFPHTQRLSQDTCQVYCKCIDC